LTRYILVIISNFYISITLLYYQEFTLQSTDIFGWATGTVLNQFPTDPALSWQLPKVHFAGSCLCSK